jgi:hypothetical protein
VTAPNPALYRRIAAAVQHMRLEMPDRVVVARLVERATRFEDLPGWLQTLVNHAERRRSAQPS